VSDFGGEHHDTSAGGHVQLLGHDGKPWGTSKPCLFSLNEDWLIRGRSIQFKPGKGTYIGFIMQTGLGPIEVLFDKTQTVTTDEDTLTVDPFIRLHDPVPLDPEEAAYANR
jgi:hypothetical protein